MAREHRLYQADWLKRVYGYSNDEMRLAYDGGGFLPLDEDPKQSIAVHNLDAYPLDVNDATKEQLLRVPGVGPTSASRILANRRAHTIDNWRDLKTMGVVQKRAWPFLRFPGHRPPRAQQLKLDLFSERREAGPKERNGTTARPETSRRNLRSHHLRQLNAPGILRRLPPLRCPRASRQCRVNFGLTSSKPASHTAAGRPSAQILQPIPPQCPRLCAAHRPAPHPDLSAAVLLLRCLQAQRQPAAGSVSCQKAHPPQATCTPVYPPALRLPVQFARSCAPLPAPASPSWN